MVVFKFEKKKEISIKKPRYEKINFNISEI